MAGAHKRRFALQITCQGCNDPVSAAKTPCTKCETKHLSSERCENHVMQHSKGFLVVSVHNHHGVLWVWGETNYEGIWSLFCSSWLQGNSSCGSAACAKCRNVPPTVACDPHKCKELQSIIREVKRSSKRSNSSSVGRPVSASTMISPSNTSPRHDTDISSLAEGAIGNVPALTSASPASTNINDVDIPLKCSLSEFRLQLDSKLNDSARAAKKNDLSTLANELQQLEGARNHFAAVVAHRHNVSSVQQDASPHDHIQQTRLALQAKIDAVNAEIKALEEHRDSLRKDLEKIGDITSRCRDIPGKLQVIEEAIASLEVTE